MEREKMNKEITALYCRLSKEDKQSGESMSISTQKAVSYTHLTLPTTSRV